MKDFVVVVVAKVCFVGLLTDIMAAVQFIVSC